MYTISALCQMIHLNVSAYIVKATKYKVGFKLVRLLGLGILMVMQNKALVCAL